MPLMFGIKNGMSVAKDLHLVVTTTGIKAPSKLCNILLQANIVPHYVTKRILSNKNKPARYPSLATNAEILKLLKYGAVLTALTQTKTRRRADDSNIESADLAGKRSSPLHA